MATSQLDGFVLFARVVGAGSFSAAARVLGMQVSSVSRRISALEDDLGVRLLDRTSRRLRPTEAGETLLEHAQQISASLEEARVCMAAVGAQPSGMLQISAPATMAPLAISVVPDFVAAHDKVQVGLSFTDRVVNLFEDGVDVAIRFGALTDQGLTARRVATSTSLVCASPGYLRARSVPATPSELSGHACLLFRARPGHAQWRFESEDGPEQVRVSGPLTADNGAALVDAARRGLGIIQMPSWLVGKSVEAGDLVPILSDYTLVPSSTPIHAVFPHRRHVPPKVRVFVDFLVERWAEGLPYA